MSRPAYARAAPTRGSRPSSSPAARGSPRATPPLRRWRDAGQAAHGLRRALPHAVLSRVGAAAMLSRAQAGVVQGRALFSLPGSPNACRLALEKLILPELGHLLREINR